jgi:hypothetical protein
LLLQDPKFVQYRRTKAKWPAFSKIKAEGARKVEEPRLSWLRDIWNDL